MRDWQFLTNHALALLVVAQHPDARLRDIAADLDVTERTAFVIVNDLIGAGYLVKEKDGRRNRYHVQVERSLHDEHVRTRTIGDLLQLLGAARPGGNPAIGVTLAARSTASRRPVVSRGVGEDSS